LAACRTGRGRVPRQVPRARDGVDDPPLSVLEELAVVARRAWPGDGTRGVLVSGRRPGPRDAADVDDVDTRRSVPGHLVLEGDGLAHGALDAPHLDVVPAGDGPARRIVPIVLGHPHGCDEQGPPAVLLGGDMLQAHAAPRRGR